MPLPVAHGLIGASVVAAFWPAGDARAGGLRRPLLVGAFLAVCPDFDYALNLFRSLGGGWHHGFTHSFVFALFAGLAAAAATGAPGRRGVAVYGAAALSHALFDYLFTESRGVALLWPFSAAKLRLRIPNPVDYDWDNSSVRRAAPDLLSISLDELMIFAPILAAALLLGRALRGAQRVRSARAPGREGTTAPGPPA